MLQMTNPVSMYNHCMLRLGESQPGDMQGQLAAALAYIKQLEVSQIQAGAPSNPGSLRRATPLADPGIANRLYRHSTHTATYVYTEYIYIYIHIILNIYIYMYIDVCIYIYLHT